jgi:VIT1/CCC1 family predicted Fe2+/Mn2+ transporter
MSENRITDFAKTALADELRTSAVYDKLARTYKDAALSKKLSGLAEMESRHARFWTDFLGKREVRTSGFRVSRFRVFFSVLLCRLLGIGLSLKILERGEHNAVRHYTVMLRNPRISETEKTGINQILTDELSHEEEFEEHVAKFKFFIDKVAVIFTQMSGGLVTVLSVSAGFAGAYKTPMVAAVAGLIVGVTGALNSALGFYFFGKTEKQIKLGIIDRVKTATGAVPNVFSKRVAKHMKKKDISEETARIIAEEAAGRKDLLDRLVLEEGYGIREEKLENPLESAFYAGLFRIVGTVLPLVPYLFSIPLMIALPISVLITLAMLALTGFLVAIAAEIDAKQKIAELTISGLIMTAITFLIGLATSNLMETMVA